MKKKKIEKAFLPVSKDEMVERGWYYYDFLVVTADAYIDHPSFGTAIIARVLEAEGYRVLLEEYGLTQEQAAQQVGKSRSAVANALRLLTLSDEVRALVENGELPAGHARALLTLPNGRLQKAAAQKILALRLSVRQAEAMCKRMAAEEKPKEEPEPLAVDYIAECEKHLTRRLGRRVHIVNGKRKGRVELDFYGDDDLQKLYEALCALKRTEDTHGG